MVDSISISLKAWPATDANKDTLPALISRINEQRGSFRNISEGKLEEESQQPDPAEVDLEDQTHAAPGEDSHDVKPRREEVSAAREEILKEIAHAYVESAHALDFVSLMLSKNTPRQAELTMSPFLKQNLPMACLGTDIVQAPQKSEAEKQIDELISVGWKMQSLDSAADSLLRSATRLEQEIERETRYWGQVLGVKEHGWSLCRLPREKHTLGVRYGFAEAHSDFRDRGLAALRRDGNGNVNLDRGIRSSEDRVLRVRVLKHGKQTGSSGKLPEQTQDDVPVETLILNARNSIFDEELQHELHREAVNYVNHGIRCIDGKIILPYRADGQIEIDLLRSSNEDTSFSNDEVNSDNTVSNSIAICLRILLSHAHRQNLHRRCQLPPRITENKTPRPLYAILRPIVEILQHRSKLHSLKMFLNRVSQTLSAAGLSLRVGDPTLPYNLSNIFSAPTNPTVSAMEALVNALTLPLQSSITMHLPSTLTTIKLEIHTSLQPPFSGTSFQSSTMSSPPSSIIATMSPTMQFSTALDLETHVLHLVQLDILSFLASNPNPPGSNDSDWAIHSPHDGLMSRTNLKTGARDRVSVELESERLSSQWQRRGQAPGLNRKRKWEFEAGGNPDDGERKGLLAAIREVVRDDTG